MEEILLGKRVKISDSRPENLTSRERKKKIIGAVYTAMILIDEMLFYCSVIGPLEDRDSYDFGRFLS